MIVDSRINIDYVVLANEVTSDWHKMLFRPNFYKETYSYVTLYKLIVEDHVEKISNIKVHQRNRQAEFKLRLI